MTAKETLLDKVSAYSEEEAVTLLQRLEWEELEFPRPLTADQLEAADRAIAQLDDGLGVTQEELYQRFALRS